MAPDTNKSPFVSDADAFDAAAVPGYADEEKLQHSAADYSLSSLKVKSQERYELLRSIGFGGMKCVLLVYDRESDREIAMAMMPDFRERPREVHEQFVREAKITAMLEHPNIVAVHEIGLDRNGAPFYTMAYLRGRPLNIVLRRIKQKQEFESRYYTLERRLRIFMRVCNAVNFAHSKNICHLDIKPDNINVGQYGEVRLFDWGLACETDAEGNAILRSGTKLRGTPGYMAPEQISDNPDAPKPGKCSDIYALGALLYSMLTLEIPFSSSTPQETLRRTMMESPFPMSKYAAKDIMIPGELEQVCRKAMAKNPADRFQSVNDLRQAIWKFQNRIYLADLNAGKRHIILGVVFVIMLVLTSIATWLLRSL